MDEASWITVDRHFSWHYGTFAGNKKKCLAFLVRQKIVVFLCVLTFLLSLNLRGKTQNNKNEIFEVYSLHSQTIETFSDVLLVTSFHSVQIFGYFGLTRG